jgi:hypothetical protein
MYVVMNTIIHPCSLCGCALTPMTMKLDNKIITFCYGCCINKMEYLEAELEKLLSAIKPTDLNEVIN